MGNPEQLITDEELEADLAALAMETMVRKQKDSHFVLPFLQPFARVQP